MRKISFLSDASKTSQVRAGQSRAEQGQVRGKQGRNRVQDERDTEGRPVLERQDRTRKENREREWQSRMGNVVRKAGGK